LNDGQQDRLNRAPFAERIARVLLGLAGDEASGRAFLEKIIQIPLKLPVAAKEDLRSLCFEQIDRALASARITLTREQVGEFVAGFDSAPPYVIAAIRDADRPRYTIRTSGVRFLTASARETSDRTCIRPASTGFKHRQSVRWLLRFGPPA
jgi:hypothetical protein